MNWEGRGSSLFGHSIRSLIARNSTMSWNQLKVDRAEGNEKMLMDW
jgi:hypothetical protein